MLRLPLCHRLTLPPVWFKAKPSLHGQVVEVNVHSLLHYVLLLPRATTTVAPALCLKIPGLVLKYPIATRSIGQKYARTESVRLGARYASKMQKVAPGACANTSSRRDGAKRASRCVGFIMVSQESWLVKMDRIAVARHHTTSITRERCHIVQGHH